VQVLTHPLSHTTIVGVRLPPGTKIRENDKYDSTRGTWETGDSIAGLTIEPGCQTIWVRQPGPLSENARILLGYLNSHRFNVFNCIGERRGNFYVIPSPTFNWDGRFDIGSQRVQHPACVQELVDHGYLAFGRHGATNWMSDYSTVWENHQNRVYTLTDEGKKEGLRLLVQ
jgi:hypothetical protein